MDVFSSFLLFLSGSAGEDWNLPQENSICWRKRNPIDLVMKKKKNLSASESQGLPLPADDLGQFFGISSLGSPFHGRKNQKRRRKKKNSSLSFKKDNSLI
jgi:hypothetical protein